MAVDNTRLQGLVTASHDSRLGFQFEQEYVYTPYSLQERLNLLKETLEKQLAAARHI